MRRKDALQRRRIGDFGARVRIQQLEVKNMRYSLNAFAGSLSLLWGGAMLFVGLIHMAAPSYGGEFLRMTSSVYPGADTSPALGRVLLGTVYGLVDGAIGGYIFGLLYRALAHAPAVPAK